MFHYLTKSNNKRAKLGIGRVYFFNLSASVWAKIYLLLHFLHFLNLFHLTFLGISCLYPLTFPLYLHPPSKPPSPFSTSLLASYNLQLSIHTNPPLSSPQQPLTSFLSAHITFSLPLPHLIFLLYLVFPKTNLRQLRAGMI